MLTLTFILLGVAVCYASIESATDRIFLLKDHDRDGEISNAEIMRFLNGCDAHGQVDHKVSEAEFFHCANHGNHDMRPYAVSLFHAFAGQKTWISVNDVGVQAIMNSFDGDVYVSWTDCANITDMAELHGTALLCLEPASGSHHKVVVVSARQSLKPFFTRDFITMAISERLTGLMSDKPTL